MKNLFVFFFLIIVCSLSLQANDLTNGRKLYYLAIEDEDKVEEAIQFFEKLKSEKKYIGLATTYIGSLVAVKAKHSFFPHKKFEYANDGIELMEKGLKISPNNIESLFIYGTTCYYLPFFFGKAKEAEQSLKKIISLLDNVSNIEISIVKNALKFIKENIDLTTKELEKVDSFLAMYDKE